jgi:hypothetical protein
MNIHLSNREGGVKLFKTYAYVTYLLQKKIAIISPYVSRVSSVPNNISGELI